MNSPRLPGTCRGARGSSVRGCCKHARASMQGKLEATGSHLVLSNRHSPTCPLLARTAPRPEEYPALS